jgi:hypothetical protein
MKEMGIQIGTAKNEPFTERQRRHINQQSIERELLVIPL